MPKGGIGGIPIPPMGGGGAKPPPIPGPPMPGIGGAGRASGSSWAYIFCRKHKNIWKGKRKNKGKYEIVWERRVKLYYQDDIGKECRKLWERNSAIQQTIRISAQITCCAITSFSSFSFALTSFWASILSFTSSSTLPVYSRINWKKNEPRLKTIKDKNG